ncbi:MAG: transporter substrate-binding domain-containing protein [Coriobacteriales bacterium]|jgi:ABC-type amino acid transport substrate-binding protein
MKKISKYLLVSALGVLMMFGLAACGGSSEPAADDAAAPAEDAAAAPAENYIIATDTAFAPFEYANEAGTYEGIDIDILAAVAEDQGFTYELQPVGFDAALQAVQSGQANGVIAGMSITEERAEVFDFSEPYYDSTVCCAVAANSDIASLEDLAGQKVAIKTGTMSADWANSMAEQYGYTTTEFADSDIMYQDVMAGNSVACFEDTPVMGYGISTGNVDLKIIAEAESDGDFATPYGFAVKKGENAELLQKFNDGLANIKANGKFDEIVAKYISAE